MSSDRALRLLFICTSNRLRSPTAERVFTEAGYAATSAGTDRAATRVVSAADIEAADAVLCMERHHRDKLRKRFRDAVGAKPVIVLGIPDDNERDQPELVEILQNRVTPFLANLTKP